MPDPDQIKQGKQGARDRRGRFPKTRSINPDGGGQAVAEAQDCGEMPSSPVPRSMEPAIMHFDPAEIAYVPTTGVRRVHETPLVAASDDTL
jgi:hypothetical protein